jgi:hypothetical protein
MRALNLVRDILNDRSYHIEFNGHLTNHGKHAVIALAGLGVEPERVKKYYDDYTAMTTYGYSLEAPKCSKHEIRDDNWRRFLGKRTSFSSYCDFFASKIEKNGLSNTLETYLPELLPGWVGSLTHATIHLGWALEAQNTYMAIEGLAYMAFSYVSCHPERSVAGMAEHKDSLESLLSVASMWDEHGEGLSRWVETLIADKRDGILAGIHPELVRSGLQYRVARLLGHGHPKMYEIPEWIETKELPECWEELYRATTLMYLAAPGDFVLLHMITSLYAMERIALHLPVEQQRSVMRCFWIGMGGTLFSRAMFPSAQRLRDVAAKYERLFDNENDPVVVTFWDSVVSQVTEDPEEHNAKLAYVLRTLWKRFGFATLWRCAAAEFTATPQLPPSFEEPPNE